MATKKWLELAAEIKAAQAKDNATDYPVVSAEIWAVGQAAPSYKVTCIINGAVKDNGEPMKEVPTSGSPPKAYPGAPGHGGDGGRIVTTFASQLEGHVWQNAGAAGAMAQNVPAAAKGQPSKWSVVKVTYHPQYLTPDLELGGVFVMFKNINQETEDGPPGIAPGPNPDVRAYPGSLTQAQFAWAWLSAPAVRAFIGYARDVILSGHTEGLREKLVLYRDITAQAAQVLADAPGYKEIVEKVKDLNKRKASFMEELLSVLDTIHDCSTTILKNQLALIKLRGQLNVTLDLLNPEAVQYVRDMGQRARDRLLLYQYYLVKSYQYLMLKDLPIIDYRSQKLIDGFANALKTSPDGTLSPNEYDKLRTIFEDQLSEVGKSIIQCSLTLNVKYVFNRRPDV